MTTEQSPLVHFGDVLFFSLESSMPQVDGVLCTRKGGVAVYKKPGYEQPNQRALKGTAQNFWMFVTTKNSSHEKRPGSGDGGGGGGEMTTEDVSSGPVADDDTLGRVVNYGETVRVREFLGTMCLSLRRTASVEEPAVYLSDAESVSLFKILPGSKARAEGEPLQVGDSIILLNVHTLMMVDGHFTTRLPFDTQGYEIVRASLDTCLWTIHRYGGRVGPRALASGEVISLHHREYGGRLSSYRSFVQKGYKPRESRHKLLQSLLKPRETPASPAPDAMDTSPIGRSLALLFAPSITNVLPAHRLTRDGRGSEVQRDIVSDHWIIEKVKGGGPIHWFEIVRFKHALTGLYLGIHPEDRDKIARAADLDDAELEEDEDGLGGGVIGDIGGAIGKFVVEAPLNVLGEGLRLGLEGVKAGLSGLQKGFEGIGEGVKGITSMLKGGEFRDQWIRKNFAMDEQETVLDAFSCALKRRIFNQGHMFVTQNFVFFYTNIFGRILKESIPIRDIVVLEKKKTFIFPNAILIATKEKEWFFSSFLSRKRAFSLISRLWRNTKRLAQCKETFGESVEEESAEIVEDHEEGYEIIEAEEDADSVSSDEETEEAKKSRGRLVLTHEVDTHSAWRFVPSDKNLHKYTVVESKQIFAIQSISSGFYIHFDKERPLATATCHTASFVVQPGSAVSFSSSSFSTVCVRSHASIDDIWTFARVDPAAYSVVDTSFHILWQLARLCAQMRPDAFPMQRDTAKKRVDSPGKLSESPRLHVAARDGNLDELEGLLKSGVDINAPDPHYHNRTALHFGAAEGHTSIVNVLLKRGADVNAASTINDTPLHLGAKNGHMDIVVALVEAGANVFMRDEDGRTPVEMAKTETIRGFLKKAVETKRAQGFSTKQLEQIAYHLQDFLRFVVPFSDTLPLRTLNLVFGDRCPVLTERQKWTQNAVTTLGTVEIIIDVLSHIPPTMTWQRVAQLCFVILSGLAMGNDCIAYRILQFKDVLFRFLSLPSSGILHLLHYIYKSNHGMCNTISQSDLHKIVKTYAHDTPSRLHILAFLASLCVWEGQPLSQNQKSVVEVVFELFEKDIFAYEPAKDSVLMLSRTKPPRKLDVFALFSSTDEQDVCIRNVHLATLDTFVAVCRNRCAQGHALVRPLFPLYLLSFLWNQMTLPIAFRIRILSLVENVYIRSPRFQTFRVNYIRAYRDVSSSMESHGGTENEGLASEVDDLKHMVSQFSLYLDTIVTDTVETKKAPREGDLSLMLAVMKCLHALSEVGLLVRLYDKGNMSLVASFKRMLEFRLTRVEGTSSMADTTSTEQELVSQIQIVICKLLLSLGTVSASHRLERLWNLFQQQEHTPKEEDVLRLTEESQYLSNLLGHNDDNLIALIGAPDFTVNNSALRLLVERHGLWKGVLRDLESVYILANEDGVAAYLDCVALLKELGGSFGQGVTSQKHGNVVSAILQRIMSLMVDDAMEPIPVYQAILGHLNLTCYIFQILSLSYQASLKNLFTFSYKLLYLFAKNNPDATKAFYPHVRLMLSHMGHELGISTLMRELLSNQDFVIALSEEDLHFVIRLIPQFGRKPRYVRLLSQLCGGGQFVNKRNQTMIIQKIQEQRSAFLHPFLLEGDRSSWDDLLSHAQVENRESDLHYVISLITLLGDVCKGQNTEAQMIVHAWLGLESIAANLVDPTLPFLVRSPYWHYVHSAYLLADVTLLSPQNIDHLGFILFCTSTELKRLLSTCDLDGQELPDASVEIELVAWRDEILPFLMTFFSSTLLLPALIKESTVMSSNMVDEQLGEGGPAAVNQKDRLIECAECLVRDLLTLGHFLQGGSLTNLGLSRPINQCIHALLQNNCVSVQNVELRHDANLFLHTQRDSINPDHETTRRTTGQERSLLHTVPRDSRSDSVSTSDSAIEFHPRNPLLKTTITRNQEDIELGTLRAKQEDNDIETRWMWFKSEVRRIAQDQDNREGQGLIRALLDLDKQGLQNMIDQITLAEYHTVEDTEFLLFLLQSIRDIVSRAEDPKSRQQEINSLGGTRRTLELLHTTDPLLLISCFKTLCVLLQNGELSVQRTILRRGRVLFVKMDRILAAPIEKGKDQQTSTTNAHENELFEMTLRILKLLCLGHNEEAQRFLTGQDSPLHYRVRESDTLDLSPNPPGCGETPINMVTRILQVLDVLIPSEEDWLSGRCSVGQLFQLRLVIDTLTNFVQGPCVSNQRCILQSSGLDNLLRLLSLPLCWEQGIKSGDLVVEHHLDDVIYGTRGTEERKLLRLVATLLLALLEGKEHMIHVGVMNRALFRPQLHKKLASYDILLTLLDKKILLAAKVRYREIQAEAMPLFLLYRYLCEDERRVVRPVTIEGVSPRHFHNHTRSVEIVRDGNVERVFFARAMLSHHFTRDDKREIEWSVTRTPVSDKLEDFHAKSQSFYRILQHRDRISSSPWKNRLAERRRTLWAVSASQILTVLINILVVLSTSVGKDTEDRILTAIGALGAIHFVFSVLLLVSFTIFKFSALMEERYQALLKEQDEREAERQVFLLSFLAQRAHRSRVARLFLRCYFFVTLEVLYRLLSPVFSLLGLVASRYFFAFHLVELVSQSGELLNVLRSVTRNGWSLLLTAFLGGIGLYFFAIFAFLYFKDAFYLRDDDPHSEILCSSIASCWSIILAQFPSGGDWLRARLTRSGLDTPGAGWEALFQLAFYFLFMIMFLNILLGIIVDTFAQLRSEREFVLRDMSGKCFMCDLGAHLFDYDEADGFSKHIRGEHNMWAYLHYYVFLHSKDESQLDGTELFVKKRLDQGDISVYPINRSLSLEASQSSRKKTEAEQRRDYTREIKSITRELSHMEVRVRSFERGLKGTDALLHTIREQIEQLEQLERDSEEKNDVDRRRSNESSRSRSGGVERRRSSHLPKKL